MLESLIKKMQHKIPQSMIKEQDTLSPVETNWIDNNGNNIIDNFSDQIIFKTV